MSDSSMDRNSIEVLAEEFVARYRNGERPPLSEYTQRYPEHAEEIVDLFPAMLLMENLRPSDHSQESPQQQDVPKAAAPPFAQLGDYRIIREVGRGGMGVVYEAEQVTLGRRVALKLLPKEMHSNARHRLRFEREARAAAKLHHTNIVPVFGVGFEEQQCYYVMQFIQGQALDKILDELHRMNIQPGAAAPLKQPAESRSSAGIVAHMLLTGVFHPSDNESVDEPKAEAADSFGATIVPGASIGSESPKGTPAAGPAKEAQRQGRPGGLAAKSTDSLKLSNSSITLSGRSGERPTKTSKEPTYWESVAKIGLQVAGALEYAHSQGILHRDIKPANLVLDMKGTVWVTDFGLARLQDERDLTRTGDILGTLRYMAPEVFKGQNDARSEIYALGLTLYELLALRPAFDGNSRNVLIDQVMTAEIESLGRINPEIPSDLQTLIHKAISRDPQDRYQTAGELADDLQRFVDDEPIRARRVSMIERMNRWSRHNRGLSRALAAVIALLFVINIAGPILTLRMARLNSDLKQSERRLSTTVVKLTSTADELTKARNEAVQQAEQADIAKLESLTMLADMQTERGLQAAREGQSATASLWFANAAKLTPHDRNRQVANLRRAQAWSAEAMTPASLLTTGYDAQRIEFQPGGSLLMTLQMNGLRLWDWRNEVALPWSEQLPLANDAAMSPDGTSVAALLAGGEVQLLDPASGSIRQRFSTEAGMQLIEWSPDRLRVAVAGSRLQIWNVSSEPMLESDWAHPAMITGIRFSRSGLRIASCSEDNRARVFAVNDPDSSAPLYPALDHLQGIKRRETTPIFCNSDQQLVTLSSSTHTPVLLDASTGKRLPVEWRMTGDMDRSLDVSPDGRWIAAGGSRDAILLSTDGRTSLVLPHSNHLHLAMFAPDSQSLATLGYEAIARLFPLRDLSQGSAGTPEIIPQQGTFANGAFSSDGLALAIASNQKIVIWERKSASSVVGRIFWNHPALRPRPSFDGQYVTPGVFHEFYGRFVSNQTDLRVFHALDGSAAGPIIALRGLLSDSCICSDNTSVAAVTAEGSKGWLSLFDIAKGTSKWDPIALPAQPVSIAARPGQPEAAVLCENGHLLIVETTSGRVKQVHAHPGTDFPPDASTARVAYSPDGSSIVSVLQNHQISIRDAQTGELRGQLLSLTTSGGMVRSIAFSPDSRLLATAVTGKNTAQVWSLATGEKAGPEISHPGDYFGLWSIKFSPDGRHLATSHKDGRVRLFDWQTGAVIGSPLQHTDEVNDIAFTPDGRHLLASVRNRRLHVWDVATGKIAVPLIVNHRQDGGGAVCLLGSRAVVLDEISHTVLDLSALLPPLEENVPSQLLRAELASNQKLQGGELVPLESLEWSTRWEHLVAARQTPEQEAESLARSLDAAPDFQAQQLIIARASRRGLLEKLLALKPKSLPLLLTVIMNDSRTAEGGTEPDSVGPDNVRPQEKWRKEVLTQLKMMTEQGPIEPSLMKAIAQALIADVPKGRWRWLEPVAVTGTAEATFTPQPGGFMLAGMGNGEANTLSIEGHSAVKRIAAIRLDVAPHASVSNGGVGHSAGNFFLTGAKARVRHADGTETKLKLNIAASDHVRPLDQQTTEADGPWAVLDDTSSTRWDAYPAHFRAHWLLLIPETPCDISENDTLVVELKTGDSVWPSAQLGQFRILLSEDLSSGRAHQLVAALRQNDLPALESLVAACLISDEPQIAIRLLQQASEAYAGSKLLHSLLQATARQQLGDTDAARQSVQESLAEFRWESPPHTLTGFLNSALLDFGGMTQKDVQSLAEIAVIERELERLADRIEVSPNEHRLHEERGYYFARLGRWQEAATSFTKQLDCTDDENWRIALMRAATCHLFAADYEAYRRLCERALERFPAANSVDEADVLTKVCLLVPGTVEMSRLPEETVRDAARISDGETAVSWFTACAALAAYRAERLDEARDLSLRVAPENWAAYYGLAQSVRALAEEKLGNHEEALLALDCAERRIPKELSILGKTSGESSAPVTAISVHHDWLIAELLRREAALLIHSSEARTSATDPAEVAELAAPTPANGTSRRSRDELMTTELAALQLLAGDEDGYRAACAKALTNFPGDLNPDQAASLCKTCLLIPDAVDLSALPVAQVRASINDPENSKGRESWIAASALAALRAGEFELALSEVQKQSDPEGQQGSLLLMIRAMAEEMLGRRQEALAALHTAEALIPPELRTLGTSNYTGHLPVSISTVDVDWLVAEVLRREATKLIRGADLDIAAINDFEAAALRDQFAMQGRWAEAAEAAVADFEVGPRDRALFSYAAALLILSGNTEGHETFCEEGLKWFLPCTNPDVADSICKGSLLTPDSVDSAMLPTDVLRKGIADSNHQPGWGWYHSSLALSLYRTGEYSQAINETNAIGELRGHIGALALVVRAMSEEKLGEHIKAIESLAEVERIIPEELATLGTPEHSGRSPVSRSDISLDWLIPEALRREAALLIRNHTKRQPDAAESLTALGQELFLQSRPGEALSPLRRAVELSPNSPAGHVWLGLTLNQQGEFNEAADVLTRAAELDRNSPFILNALAEVERKKKVLVRLPDFTAGKQTPQGIDEHAAVAEVCYFRNQFTQSMRFFLSAIDSEKELPASTTSLLRYNAACAAARASEGDGDGEGLSEPERINYRQQAINLLIAELASAKKQLENADPAERETILSNLRNWLIDRDLQSLHNEEPLWMEHATLLQ